MAFARHISLVLLLLVAIPRPAASVAQPSPVPSPLPGSRLVQSSHVQGPLEVRSATADDEAILAGNSYVKQSYREDHPLPLETFVGTYRDALFTAGWKLIAVPKLDPKLPPPEGDLDIAAHYMNNGRNIYLRITRTGDGAYDISVADVGEENWSAALAKECRLRIPSIHFDLDRATIRGFDSEPTLQKLADVLKQRNAPAVEIEGHMDNIGEAGAAARQALSEGRAKAVAAWLTAHGVPAARVTSQGYGKTRPIADNDSDLGRALNRRIEVRCRIE
jgi:outer membrane protein OmpA-like peptidoglycan-associated protein